VSAAGVLLERDEVLTAVREAAIAAAGGEGRLVLLTGEAGIGKSALLQRLLDELPIAARVWTGSCERLFAARPLGPLADMVGELPGASPPQCAAARRSTNCLFCCSMRFTNPP
jgi:predicted ATPase